MIPNFKYSLLTGSELLSYIHLFEKLGHGYTKMTPHRHRDIISKSMESQIGYLVTDYNTGEVLAVLTLQDGLYEDSHIAGFGIYTQFLVVLKYKFRIIRGLHTQLKQLCNEHNAKWYTMSWRIRDNVYQLKYYEV